MYNETLKPVSIVKLRAWRISLICPYYIPNTHIILVQLFVMYFFVATQQLL